MKAVEIIMGKPYTIDEVVRAVRLAYSGHGDGHHQ